MKEDRTHWEPFQSKLGMVRLILSVDWDPIGVFGHRNTLDEYDNYAERVLALAEETKSPLRIAELLGEFERDSMGLKHGSKETCLLVGKKVVNALAHFEG